MTYAEVEFLLAEASLKGWNTGSKSIDELYRTGVRAAIDFLTKAMDATRFRMKHSKNI